MAKRAKQVIPYAELLAKVQGLLAFFPNECRNIHFDSLEVYQEQIDGANWHLGGYRRSGDENDWPQCRDKIMGEIRTLRVACDVDVKTLP